MNIPPNPDKHEVLHHLRNIEHAYNSCDEERPMFNAGYNMCPRCTALELAELAWLRKVLHSVSLRTPKVKL
jgi:hypothetical protein